MRTCIGQSPESGSGEVRHSPLKHFTPSGGEPPPGEPGPVRVSGPERGASCVPGAACEPWRTGVLDRHAATGAVYPRGRLVEPSLLFNGRRPGFRATATAARAPVRARASAAQVPGVSPRDDSISPVQRAPEPRSSFGSTSARMSPPEPDLPGTTFPEPAEARRRRRTTAGTEEHTWAMVHSETDQYTVTPGERVARPIRTQ